VGAALFAATGNAAALAIHILITITGVILLLLALLSFSSNLTGFAIGNMNSSDMNISGVTLFVVGIAFLFAYVRKKKIVSLKNIKKK
jgi:hypothetical protein